MKLYDNEFDIKLLSWRSWEDAFILCFFTWGYDAYGERALITICYRGDYDRPGYFVWLFNSCVHLGWHEGPEWELFGKWGNVL